jgi:hypothetical protein
MYYRIKYECKYQHLLYLTHWTMIQCNTVHSMNVSIGIFYPLHDTHISCTKQKTGYLCIEFVGGEWGKLAVGRIHCHSFVVGLHSMKSLFLSGESSGCTGFVWVEWSDWFICLEIRAAVPCWHPLFVSFSDLLLCFIHCILILRFWASRKVKTHKFSILREKQSIRKKNLSPNFSGLQ